MQRPVVAISEFVPADMPRILEIEQASFGPDAWDAPLFEQFARRNPRLFLVARPGRRIGGYVLSGVRARKAELLSLAVHPRYRRRGIATKLLRHTRRLLRSRGIESWWLMVEATNEAAIRFYESHGFLRDGEVKGYYGRGRNAWRMCGRLDSIKAKATAR